MRCRQAEAFIAVLLCYRLRVIGDGNDAAQPIRMIEVTLPVSGKSQRFIDTGTVDESGFGGGRRAVVGDFFNL